VYAVADNNNGRKITLIIDGRDVEAEHHETLLDVCSRIGIDIPTLCHFEHVAPYGACRLCVCEQMRGTRGRLVTACNFPVEDGMVFHTDNERVQKSRHMAIELLLTRSGNAPIVQEYAQKMGIDKPRYGYGEDLCIMCGLCVRVCEELVGANAICFRGRGTERVVSTPFEIDSEACIACGACAEVCPTGVIRVEDLSVQPGGIPDYPLGPTTAIHIPFQQATPKYPIIDKDSCIHLQTGKCGICEQVCEPGAINYDQEDEIEQIDVGQIIVATGYQPFDAKKMGQYGYGRLDNVITALEFERMLNSTGPTGGKVLLKNGDEPRAIGILHCVGSRDENHNRYCSRVCCMYALKFAHIAHEKVDADVYQFYIDMRAFGKGYEEFYSRVLQEGTTVIRGKGTEVVANVTPQNGDRHLLIRCEDTLIGKYREIMVDMVILCTALEPRADANLTANVTHINRSPDGFFLERHPKLDPMGTTSEGVYLAGTCQGPKDIPDAVAQAQGAAARTLALIAKGYAAIDPVRAAIDPERCSGCRICNNLCPYDAISYNEVDSVSEVNDTLCKGCGTCVAACPAGAITGHHFSDKQLLAELEALLI